jgi:hypothetical protein
MNTDAIKRTVELAGGRFEGIQMGTGVLVTNRNTGSTFSMPLDIFYWDNLMSEIQMVKSYLTLNNVENGRCR